MQRGFLKYFLFFCFSIFLSGYIQAQCSICTRTAQQLGEQPAKGMNTGILYLAFVPMAIVSVIGYRWWKSNRVADGES